MIVIYEYFVHAISLSFVYGLLLSYDNTYSLVVHQLRVPKAAISLGCVLVHIPCVAVLYTLLVCFASN